MSMKTRQQTMAAMPFRFRKESGHYPPGAEFDARAPYNQPDDDEEEDEDEETETDDEPTDDVRR